MGARNAVRTATGLTLAAMLVACGSDPAPPPLAATEADAPSASATTARVERPRPHAASSRRSDEATNHPPVVRSLTVRADDDDPALWLAEIEADDPDGDDVSLDVVWLVNGQPAARGEHRYDPTTNQRGDAIHVEVTPHDGKMAGATAASGQIRIENAAPNITSTPPSSMAGGMYRYVVKASDPEGGGVLRYELLQKPDGMEIDPFSGELTWRPTATQAGTHPIEIAVTDSAGARTTQEFGLPIIPPGAAPASPDL